jgi:hypothetical protein
MESLAVVCFMWNTGFRAYTADHVNRLAAGYRRHLSIPHRFVCITDEPGDFSPDVTVMPLPESARWLVDLPSPEGPNYPSSYRRLWAFSKEARELGDLILMSDVDAVITGPVDPLIEYIHEVKADFVGWRPPSTWAGVRRVAGGSWLLRTGTHNFVWHGFTLAGIKAARASGQYGSDQAWLSYCLADHCALWPKGHGIFEAQWMRSNKFKTLPTGARIVHFNGKQKPWDADMQQIPWIREHWNERAGDDSVGYAHAG